MTNAEMLERLSRLSTRALRRNAAAAEETERHWEGLAAGSLDEKPACPFCDVGKSCRTCALFVTSSKDEDNRSCGAAYWAWDDARDVADTHRLKRPLATKAVLPHGEEDARARQAREEADREGAGGEVVMPYVENPKTRGSGIVCAIPQRGRCPRACPDCFFQSGRSYLEPLEEKTPNMPDRWADVRDRVVRVNDGNDSDHERARVLAATAHYPRRFYNTASPRDLEGYGAPVVLTVNPGEMTDKNAHMTGAVGDGERIPENLMFVRVRTNTWNWRIVDPAVRGWTDRDVPVVLTFMAYHDAESIPRGFRNEYAERVRTLNSYWAITTSAWRRVMERYEHNPLVHSCGREGITSACRHCGNCLREWHATTERMRAG
jgi:hypothetical protein